MWNNCNFVIDVSDINAVTCWHWDNCVWIYSRCLWLMVTVVSCTHCWKKCWQKVIMKLSHWTILISLDLFRSKDYKYIYIYFHCKFKSLFHESILFVRFSILMIWNIRELQNWVTLETLAALLHIPSWYENIPQGPPKRLTGVTTREFTQHQWRQQPPTSSVGRFPAAITTKRQ